MINGEKSSAFGVTLHHLFDVAVHPRPIYRITRTATSFFNPMVSFVKVTQCFLLLLCGNDSSAIHK